MNVILEILFEIIVRGIIRTIGNCLLFLYYKIIGKKVSLKQIQTEKDDFGMLKYGFQSVFWGIFFFVLLLILAVIIFRK